MNSQVAELDFFPDQVTLAKLLRNSFRTFILMPPRVFYWRMYRGEWPRIALRSFWRSLAFFFDRSVSLNMLTRIALIERFVRISQLVTCEHTTEEILEVSTAIFRLPRSAPGVIVEAGAFKGGSAAKLSLCAQLAGRKFFIFDSFEGIPDNQEVQSISGNSSVVFKPGSYAGSLEAVKNAIASYGSLAACEFVKGWFSDTMPKFNEVVSVGYLDVDLVSSTRDCLVHLFPRLVRHGVLFSQDAHLSGVRDLLKSEDFWRTEVGTDKPHVRGLGRKKMVAITK